MNNTRTGRHSAPVARAGGFTLIELVVVIAILGILMAVALPKFTSLQADARVAKMNGALGAVQAASAMGHAQLIAKGYDHQYTGTPGGSGSPAIVAEGVVVSYANGYPTAAVMASLAGISSTAYTLSYPAANVLRVASDTGHANCWFEYVEPLTGQPPVYRFHGGASSFDLAQCG